MGQVLAKVQQQHTNLFRAADAACVCCCDSPDRCDDGPALPWAALRAAIRACSCEAAEEASPSFCPGPASLNLASAFFFSKNFLIADIFRIF